VDFNGSTQYGSTGYYMNLINPNNIHLSFYSRDNTKIREFPMDIGWYTGSTPFYGFRLVGIMGGSGGNQNNAYAYMGTTGLSNATLYAVGPFSAAGYIIANRSSSTYSSMIRNGTLIASNTQAAISGTFASPGTEDIKIAGTGATTTMSDRQCAFATIGTAFTDSESSIVATTVNEYQKRLSRNVY
jgi:hypothetical protein